MARSFKALKKNTLKLVEDGSLYVKKAIYYGFVPALLYLGFTREPKPNIRALLGFA